MQISVEDLTVVLHNSEFYFLVEDSPLVSSLPLLMRISKHLKHKIMKIFFACVMMTLTPKNCFKS